MTEIEQEKILQRAWQLNIEVEFALSAEHVKKVGLHVVEPSVEGLFRAIERAIELRAPAVIIHSRIS